MTPEQIGLARIIENIYFPTKTGNLWVNGKGHQITFDTLEGFVSAIEAIDYVNTGMILKQKFREIVVVGDLLEPDVFMIGRHDLYEGNEDIPDNAEECFYMRVDMGKFTYHNWFTRMDELIKITYNIIRDIQDELNVSAA